MKKVIIVIFLATLPLTLHAGLRDDSIPKITEEINVRELLPLLKMGTLVLIHKNEEGIEFATGILHIKAPVKKVWETVIDYEAYKEYVPNMESVSVVEKTTDTTWKVQYNLKFRVTSFFNTRITYYLQQHYKPYSEIWGVVSDSSKNVFSDVRFREYFIDDGNGNTIFVYTAYADLKSFGYLARIIYDAFPELVTPTLVSVGTIYPEATKERIEGVRLNYNPLEVRTDSIVIPDSLTGIPEEYVKKIPPKYRFILFHNPLPGGVRFATGIVYVNTSADTLYRILSDFEHYPEFISFVKKTRVLNNNGNNFSVRYNLSFRVIIPVDIDYTLNYNHINPYSILWQLNEDEEHDISGEWGRMEVIPVNDNSSILIYSSYSNLASGGFFMKLLMKNITGYDMGLRVATTDMLLAAYKKASENH